MRTININLYKFEELSPEAKERAVNDWLNQGHDYSWCDEYLNSIKTFCDYFNIQLVSWSIDAYNYDYKIDLEHEVFRGLKLDHVSPDLCPTGYYLDLDLFGTFYGVFKTTGSAKKAFIEALEAGFLEWRKDLEYQQSAEYIAETLTVNEYEFTEEGVFYA